jgi:L-alanine-DL-glutamate epimerase-like enolase superfamily enzyme
LTDPVVSVAVAERVLALPRPLQLGPVEIRDRAYAVASVRTAAGFVGHAYCLTRNAPVQALVERLVVPHVVGRDAEQVEALWRTSQRANVLIARSGLALRALALVDVALWDIRAQRAGMPLWRLLGASEGSAPAMLVAAYPTPDRAPEAIAEEVLARSAAYGTPLLKVSRDPDPARMKVLLDHTQAGLDGSALVVDAGFAWPDAATALSETARWGDVPLAWLEDPLVPEDAEECRRVRRNGRHPVGAGDEVADRRTYDALLALDAVDVLRVDVMAVGGITPALDVLHDADAAGVPVSFHVYPEVSVHLAAAQPTPAWAELFDPDVPGGNPYDPAHLLTVEAPRLRDGRLVAGDGAGLGLRLAPAVAP